MQGTRTPTPKAFAMFGDDDDEQADELANLRLSDGGLLELPGASGRLERIDFGTGIYLHLAELDVGEDSRFDVQNSLPPGWFAGSVNVMGHLELMCPTGRHYKMTPETGLLMRVDPVGTRYFLPKGQLIRHAGITIELDALSQRFEKDLPCALDPFLSPRQDTVEIRPLALNNKIRRIVSMMFSPKISGPGRKFKLEGLSSMFLTEVIDAFCQLTPADGLEPEQEPSVLEQTLIEETVCLISNKLSNPLSVSQLAEDAGISEGRLNSLIKRQTGKSCAELIRSERMIYARELLLSGDKNIKQVAAAVGFNHVSNFSRSYRDWYGESPAQALCRKRA